MDYLSSYKGAEIVLRWFIGGLFTTEDVRDSIYSVAYRRIISHLFPVTVADIIVLDGIKKIARIV